MKQFLLPRRNSRCSSFSCCALPSWSHAAKLSSMCGIATSTARQIWWKSTSIVCARSLSKINRRSCFIPFVESATAWECRNESEDPSYSHDVAVHHRGRGSPRWVISCFLGPLGPRGSYPTQPPVTGDGSSSHCRHRHGTQCKGCKQAGHSWGVF